MDFQKNSRKFKKFNINMILIRKFSITKNCILLMLFSKKLCFCNSSLFLRLINFFIKLRKFMVSRVYYLCVESMLILFKLFIIITCTEN